MKPSHRFSVSSTLLLACLFMSLSGCVVRDHEVEHGGSYERGYQEGYYDREHHRYWHDQAWHECIEGDAHCR